jgi:hypothetical protein
MRQAILGFVRLPESLKDLLALPCRAVRQVGPSHSTEQPIDADTDSRWTSKPEGRAGAARLDKQHGIASGHQQVGWPGYLLAQAVQDGSGCLGNAIVTSLSPRHAGQVRARAVAAVTKASRDQAELFERVEHAQQTRLRYPRGNVQVVQRRNGTRVQGIEHLKTAF